MSVPTLDYSKGILSEIVKQEGARCLRDLFKTRYFKLKNTPWTGEKSQVTSFFYKQEGMAVTKSKFLKKYQRALLNLGRCDKWDISLLYLILRKSDWSSLNNTPSARKLFDREKKALEIIRSIRNEFYHTLPTATNSNLWEDIWGDFWDALVILGADHKHVEDLKRAYGGIAVEKPDHNLAANIEPTDLATNLFRDTIVRKSEIPDLNQVQTEDLNLFDLCQFGDSSFEEKKSDLESVSVLKNYADVEIYVLEAKNLLGKKSNGLSDPYVTCQVFESRLKKSTPFCKNTLNPNWMEKLNLLIPRAGSIIELQVWSHIQQKPGLLIGWQTIIPSDFIPRIPQKLWLDLEETPEGKLNVEVTVNPFS